MQGESASKDKSTVGEDIPDDFLLIQEEKGISHWNDQDWTEYYGSDSENKSENEKNQVKLNCVTSYNGVYLSIFIPETFKRRIRLHNRTQTHGTENILLAAVA